MKFDILQGEKNLVAKFRIQHFLIWNINTVFYNFAIAFFEDKGLEPTVIPYAMAVCIGTGIIGRFLWGLVIDRTQAMKRTYMALMAVTLAVIWCSALVNSVPAMFLLMGSIGLVQFPLGSILDSWILRKFRGQEGTYNTIRFFGSIGFSAFSALYGIMVDRFGWVVIYLCSLAVVGLLEVSAFFTADINTEQKNKLNADARSEKLSVLPLLKSYRLIMISVLGLFSFFACAPFNSFLVRLVEFKGGSVGSMGLAYALGAIGEVPVFLFYNKLMTKISPLVRLALGNGLFLLEFLWVYFAPSYSIALAGLIFHGAGFAVYLPTLRFCAIEMAPKGLETSAMTFTEAIYSGLSLILTFILYGWMISRFGMGFSLIVSEIILAVVTGVLLVWHLADKQNEMQLGKY